MAQQQEALGILVGGGPAPGINGVISAVAIEAINNGLKVYGFLEGFKYLMEGNTSQAKELNIEEVSKIHVLGGSVLRTSRANPTKKQEHIDAVLGVLNHFNVKYLVTIGGDDTAFSSMTVAKAAQNKIRVAHVPKTIDNDLPLPKAIPTFGYQTAREYGANIVLNLLEDAKTAGRYFIVIAMGRTAGHLALGIGKAAAAHLTLIPEEFIHHKQKISFKRICDMIEGCILKRQATGKDHGVIILAEGLLEHMDNEDVVGIFGKDNVKFDPHGHILLAELDFGKKVRDEMRDRMKKRSLSIGFTEKNLGYELRCAPPNAFDREYTRDLGYGAVKFLLGGGSGALITVQGATVVPMSFEELKDPKTGKTRVRHVDVESEGFEVAVKYMIRLTKKDFEDSNLALMAKNSNSTPEQLKSEFEYLVQ